MSEEPTRPVRTGRKLATWQRSTLVLPLGLIVGAVGVAAANGGLQSAASGSTDGSRPGIPEVPTSAFTMPGSVQRPDTTPTGIDPRAGTTGTVSTLSANGIPAAALAAYQRAESLMEEADPACKIDWTLVAAIGRVESDHGRYGGNALDADGVAQPGIIGIALDGGNGTAKITDTDYGDLDRDPVFDRAVGPMQFIPSTWAVIGVDADGDGDKNPQDIDDAAAATAVYLCAGGGDLSTEQGARTAVYRYNHSGSYVDLVLSIAASYARGDYSAVPNGLPAPITLTSDPYNYLYTPPAGSAGGRGGGPAPDRGNVGNVGNVGNNADGEQPADEPSGGPTDEPSGDPTQEPPSQTPDPGGDDGGSTPIAPPAPSPSPDNDPVNDTKDTVDKTTNDTKDTVDQTTKDPGGTVEDTVTQAEAKAQCLAQGVSPLELDKCVSDLVG